MSFSFTKMHGLGNDFVVIERDIAPETAKALADRRYGVGCDQVLVMLPPRDQGAQQADLFMKIYNPDGAEAGACGNGTRCVADLWMRAQGRDQCTIETAAGLLACRRAPGDMIEVNMGAPKLAWNEIPLAYETGTLALDVADWHAGTAVNMGNPHIVFFVDDVEAIDLAACGPLIERHEIFPERINAEFAQILSAEKDSARLRVRVWERGAGETSACGSGACAVLVAAVRRGLIKGHRAEIILDGGSLFIIWDKIQDGQGGHVLMTGPASRVFTGQWDGIAL